LIYIELSQARLDALNRQRSTNVKCKQCGSIRFFVIITADHMLHIECDRCSFRLFESPVEVRLK